MILNRLKYMGIQATNKMIVMKSLKVLKISKANSYQTSPLLIPTPLIFNIPVSGLC